MLAAVSDFEGVVEEVDCCCCGGLSRKGCCSCYMNENGGNLWKVSQL